MNIKVAAFTVSEKSSNMTGPSLKAAAEIAPPYHLQYSHEGNFVWLYQLFKFFKATEFLILYIITDDTNRFLQLLQSNTLLS